MNAQLARLLLQAAVVLALVFGMPGTHPAAATTVAAPWQAPAAPAGTTCQVLQPGPSAAKDSYIKQDSPDSRLGTNNELRVKTESGKLNRSLLQFDLSFLPPGAVVTSATLSLWVKDVRDGNVTINAHQVTASWNEAEVTWKARDKAAGLLWATQGGDYSPTVLDSESFVKGVKEYWATWSVTAAAAN